MPGVWKYAFYDVPVRIDEAGRVTKVARFEMRVLRGTWSIRIGARTRSRNRCSSGRERWTTERRRTRLRTPGVTAALDSGFLVLLRTTWITSA
jgi:hypothetical protein